MKSTLFTIACIISVSSISYAHPQDTMMFWHIYYNDEVYAKLDALYGYREEPYIFTFDADSIQAGDSLQIRIGACWGDDQLVEQVEVYNDEEKEICHTSSIGEWTPNMLYFDELLASGEKEFELWYYTGEYKGEDYPRRMLLFKFRIE